jgi:hypothetical protein
MWLLLLGGKQTVALMLWQEQLFPMLLAPLLINDYIPICIATLIMNEIP